MHPLHRAVVGYCSMILVNILLQGAFTGNTVEISAVDSPVVLKATDAACGQCLL